MTSFYVDTSAIAKRYLTTEQGAAWVANLTSASAGNVIILTDLTVVEMCSVLARLVEDSKLSTLNAAKMKRQFLSDVRREYLVFPLDKQILRRARDLPSKHHRLRALDSIQLAGALEATIELNEQLTFISTDNNLLVAASAEGFRIDNPNVHP